jgi:hypothetical protein
MKFLKTSLTEIKYSRKYKSLISCWENKYALYSLIPLNKIFKLLHIKEFNIFKGYRIKSTNFNYTLFSKKTSKPVMSIDFLNEGYRFGEGGEFVLLKNPEGTINTNKSFELKLELARKVKYPYFLVNTNNDVLPDVDTHMQIVRSIVDFYLSRIKIYKKAKQFLKNDSNIISGIDSLDCLNYIRDFILIPIKIESNRKYNYIRKLNIKYESKIIKKGYSYSTTEILLPAEINGNGIKECILNKFKEKIIGMADKEFATICEIKTNKKIFLEMVTIKTSIEAPVMGLSRELAKLTAFKKVLI